MTRNAYRTTTNQLLTAWCGLPIDEQLEFAARLATTLRKSRLNPPSAVHRAIQATVDGLGAEEIERLKTESI